MTLLTEQGAKEKWCPFARVIAPMHTIGQTWVAAAGNRLGFSDAVAIAGSTHRQNPEAARCIASECMAWRWGADPDFLEVAEQPKGFCGLAGAPQ